MSTITIPPVQDAPPVDPRLLDALNGVLSVEWDYLPHGGYWTSGEAYSDRDIDCFDWGLIYGMAYAIARGQAPYDAERAVRTRAITAAREAHLRYTGAPSQVAA